MMRGLHSKENQYTDCVYKHAVLLTPLVHKKYDIL